MHDLPGDAGARYTTVHIPRRGMKRLAVRRAIRLCVELAELDAAEEGSPLAWGEDERGAVRVLAVANGDDPREIAGALDTVAAVVTAAGTLPPCRLKKVCMA